MPRLTRSIPQSASTEPPERNIFVHGLAEAVLRDSDSPHSRHHELEKSPSPDHPDFLEQTDSDSSDDDAVDIPYRIDEEDEPDVSVGISRRTKSSATKQDPGPSVRVRTPAELDAVIETQVEDSEYCIYSSL